MRFRKIARKKRPSIRVKTIRKNKARVAFARWLKVRDPFMYRLAVKRHQIKRGMMHRNNSGLSGYDSGDFLSEVVPEKEDQPWWKSLTSTIEQVAPAIATASLQRKLLKVQMARAEKGLPPLEASQYAPAIKISPEITPESEAALTRMAKSTLSDSLKKAAVIAIPATIGLVVWIARKRKRR